MAVLFSGDFLGAPVWFWAVFAAVIAGVLIFDLGYLNRRIPILSLAQSMLLTGSYTALAVVFGIGVWLWFGPGQGRVAAGEQHGLS